MPNPKGTIVQFARRPALDEEEVSVSLPPSSFVQPGAVAVGSAADLSAKPKVWFAIGPGRSGKTMLLRWAAEMTANQGGSAIVAAADPQNRSLKNYLEGVAEPPTNDAVATSRWLEALLRHVMDEKASAMVDLGGGDTALHKLLAMVPDLAESLEGAGVAPVAIYTLGPRVDDLAALASFEALGFQPAATVLGTQTRDSLTRRPTVRTLLPGSCVIALTAGQSSVARSRSGCHAWTRRLCRSWRRSGCLSCRRAMPSNRNLDRWHRSGRLIARGSAVGFCPWTLSSARSSHGCRCERGRPEAA